MGAFFLLGLAIVAMAAFALTLLPPSKVGSLAALTRYLAAGFLAAMGALLMARGLELPGGILLAAGAFVIWRNRLGLGSRGSNGSQDAAQERYSGAMSVDEAYAVLGLKPGANADEIRKAHRDLIQKIHPDHGGTSYLAAKLNQARDLLLDRVGS